jgi:hypothetical protein
VVRLPSIPAPARDGAGTFVTRKQLWYLSGCLLGCIEGLLFSGQHYCRGMALAIPTGFCVGMFLYPWVQAEEEG